MFAAGLITFREALEAILVVGIILTFLTKTNQNFFKRFVWYGIGVGLFLSATLAFSLDAFYGGLEGSLEKYFEGALMFVTAGFLTWMILWVHRQKDVAEKMREKVAKHAKEGYGIGIVILVTSSIFREGTETVLYLKASSIAGVSGQMQGAILGIAAALLLGYFIFRWALRVRLATIFTVTSVFLVMFAAGLVAHGVHEFQEVGALPVFAFDPLINISHILDHQSTIGSFLRVLFGYTSKPTMFEVVSYSSYILFILWLERVTDRLVKAKSAK